jgi:hypothetical protein
VDGSSGSQRQPIKTTRFRSATLPGTPENETTVEIDASSGILSNTLQILIFTRFRCKPFILVVLGDIAELNLVGVKKGVFKIDLLNRGFTTFSIMCNRLSKKENLF